MEILIQPCLELERRKEDSFEPEATGMALEDNMECLVFRTSLQNRKDVEKASAVLDNLTGISDWHVDLDDWEKVLRIECTGLSAVNIIETLFDEGVMAEEMPTD